MSRQLTKNLFESVQAKLDAATAAVTAKREGGKGDKSKTAPKRSSSSSKKGRKANKTGAAAAAARPKRKVPSTAEERLKRNVCLLKKLGAHRTQAQVLKKVGVVTASALIGWVCLLAYYVCVRV